MLDAATVLQGYNSMTNGQSLKQILIGMRKLLENDEKWATNGIALDAEGHIVKAHDPSAVMWDLIGAAAVCSNDYGISPPPVILFLDHMCAKASGGEYDEAGRFNDNIDHEGLLAMLDMAIEEASV